jgi:hypothetical protein
MADISLVLWLNSETFNPLEAELAKKSTVKKQKTNVMSVVETPMAPNPQAKKPPVIIKILIVIVLLVGLVLLFVASQPTRYIITHQITIEAPVAKVIKQVNDFHNWVDWSPWEKMDPSIKRTYEKPETGVGAVCNWVGNDSVGTGKMVITESDISHINVELDYQFPPIGKLFYRFDFTPNNKETLVSWQLYGDDDFSDKLNHLISGRDKTVDAYLANGLAQLKAITEVDK